MTINGRVVAISRVNVKDSNSTAAAVAVQLREAIKKATTTTTTTTTTTSKSPPQQGNDAGAVVVDQVALHGIEIDDTVIGALVDLLSSKQHQNLNKKESMASSPTLSYEWDCLRFINCTGEVGKAISACTELGSEDEQQVIIKHVEIDLQLVDELDDMSFLQRLLSSKTSTVEGLRLSTSLSPNEAKFIAAGLESTNVLTSLDLRWTEFKNYDSIEVLSGGLTRNKTLKYIDFTSCNLTDDQMSKLIKALHGHSNLETLKFQSNNCGPKSSEQISSMLRSSRCNVRDLDLGFQLRNDPQRTKMNCLPIIKALRTNKTLTRLDLTCNRLDDGDATFIADTLTTNTTIEELFLTRNEFTETGIKTIAHRLPDMKHLKKLSLWGNRGLTEKTAGLLLDGLKNNIELQSLNLFRHFHCSHQIQYTTTINQSGGRKLFQSKTELPLGLWPSVFERANKMKLLQRKEDLSTPQQRRTDMIFYMLKELAIGPLAFRKEDSSIA